MKLMFQVTGLLYAISETQNKYSVSGYIATYVTLPS